MSAILAPLLAVAAAAATPAPAALPGIWEGNVGDLPVRVCFVQRDWATFGAYYYRSRLRLIPLEPVEGAGGAFREGGDGTSGPVWRIEQADGTRLTATWTGGGRSLAVRLNRIAGAEGEEGPCARLAFHQPRLEGIRVLSAPAAKDGVAYSRLTLDHRGRFDVQVRTFSLDGTSGAVRRINAILARPLTGHPPQWLECTSAALEDAPNEGMFDENLEPNMISAHWMSVVQRDDMSCGGAHPDSGQVYRIFDRATGLEIDLHDWLNARALARERPAGADEEIKTIRPALRRVILARWRPAQAECREVMRGAEYWTIGLTRRGLIFSPDLAHVVQACGEEFTLSLAQLRPFLTNEGARQLAALAGEQAPRR